MNKDYGIGLSKNFFLYTVLSGCSEGRLTSRHVLTNFVKYVTYYLERLKVVPPLENQSHHTALAN
jgi:hypothetical protein